MLKNRFAVVLMVVLAVATLPVAMVGAKWLTAPGYYGNAVNVAMPAFEGRDGLDQSVASTLLDGNLNLVFFGNTRCASICPPRILLFQQIQDQLAQQQQVLAPQFLLFTVDLEFDTPARLYDYFQAYDERFIGIRVTQQAFWNALAANLGFSSRAMEPGQFAHTDTLYLVDANGTVVLAYSGKQLHADTIVADMLTLAAAS